MKARCPHRGPVRTPTAPELRGLADGGRGVADEAADDCDRPCTADESRPAGCRGPRGARPAPHHGGAASSHGAGRRESGSCADYPSDDIALGDAGDARSSVTASLCRSLRSTDRKSQRTAPLEETAGVSARRARCVVARCPKVGRVSSSRLGQYAMAAKDRRGDRHAMDSTSAETAEPSATCRAPVAVEPLVRIDDAVSEVEPDDAAAE